VIFRIRLFIFPVCLLVFQLSADSATAERQKVWVKKEIVVAGGRAMIKPPEDVLEQEAAGNPVEKASPVLAAPIAGAEEIKTFPWGSYHFIYGRSGDYVLIGSAEALDEGMSSDKFSKSLHGWVDKNNLAEGSSRETYWWNHENAGERQPALAFKFPEKAYDFAAGKQAPAFFEEILNSQSPDHSRRFPAFPYKGDGNFPRVHPDTNARLFKIGMLAQKGVGEKERKNIEKSIDRKRKQLNQVDIVFVIDDTASMVKWFPHVEDIVKHILYELQSEADLQVRIAISYFNDRDKITGIHNPDTNALSSDNDAIERQLNGLQTHREQRRIEADPAEMMFDGIEKAIDAAGYDSAAYKILVVIGTDPDKSGIPDLSGGEEHAKKIADRLRQKGRPIDLRAVQLVKPSGDRQKFAEQIKNQILAPFRRQREETLGLPAGAEQDLGGVINTQDPETIEKYVLDRFRRLKKNNAADQGRLRRMIHGDWDTAFGPGMEAELRSRNIDPEKLKHDSVEYQPVFVWEKDKEGRRQIRPWVMMDEPELKKTEQFMAGLVDRIDSEQPVRDVVRDQVEALTGKAPEDNESAEDLIKNKLGLPVSTPILTKTLDQLAALSASEDQKEILDSLTILKRRLAAIQRVTQRAPDYIDPVSFNKWYWVDAEEQLP